MNVDDVRELVFKALAEPIAHLGCAGPPECELEGCTSTGDHDTFLAMRQDVIEVTIDDQEYEIRVVKTPSTRGWSRKDIIGD